MYVAHPFRNDPEGNTEKVGIICKEVIAQGKVIPISPIHLFGYLDPQDDVMSVCLRVMDACDETWFYGDFQNSEGCQLEIKHLKRTRQINICTLLGLWVFFISAIVWIVSVGR